MRIALFTGSFDPPHVGHTMAMTWALSTAPVQRMIVAPYFKHPFGRPLADYEHRLAMARLAASPLRYVEVSDMERDFGTESRTLRTVQELYLRKLADEIVFVMGADLVPQRERWYGYRELSRLVEFLVVGRAGHGGDVAVPDVSSSDIRARLARGESVEGRVPSAVAAYIAAHGLYRASAVGSAVGSGGSAT